MVNSSSTPFTFLYTEPSVSKGIGIELLYFCCAYKRSPVLHFRRPQLVDWVPTKISFPYICTFFPIPFKWCISSTIINLNNIWGDVWFLLCLNNFTAAFNIKQAFNKYLRFQTSMRCIRQWSSYKVCVSCQTHYIPIFCHCILHVYNYCH